MKVGFIGLGAMGSGIAANILREGHELVVWNRSPGPLEALKAQGAVVAKSPEETLTGDALFTMLANDAAVSAIGLDGPLLDKAAKGLVHVNMATVSTAFAKALTEAHRARGLGYVASPVFGRPDAAAAGKLTVVAAGAREDIAKVEPILTKIGAKYAVVGSDPVQANLFKISGNFMIAAAIEAMGEAAALLQKGGVDPAVFFDVLTSANFNAPIYKIYGKIIAEQSYDQAGFKLSLGYKDAGLTLAAAKEFEAPLPLASLVHDHFLAAMAAGWGEKDWASLAKLAADRTKVATS
ncbi:3-hydroxyisobutyrate dehydrogenase-like beta-hydroxyacid dehydrogenase [Rhizomicrobium palustre]|uniref:3-hydroxyisobutyrate dehydrogenase-like beta-hydroxyacid dehydrogenase n=1 Tax=Rhizomicrobium palustre TaxID=189966 RepID=A0A846N1N3_9PROT|nr:NAD(P)-dependent oxidoreductase [Rhizomicrobium palustre]NIK89858.1 3-hydroxyisobutyrate dehydrogenase-like beta-hydroxyacid dehydrogenase [Rhizomicrobium palustre]